MALGGTHGQDTSTSVRVAIDIGGTFTDVVAWSGDRDRLLVMKVLSTPEDPARGAELALLSLLAEAGVEITNVREIVHATTIATNAVLEGKGARTGLITTRGFRDILEIGREWRYDLHDLHLRKPRPLVPRKLRKEVTERVDYRGEVLIPFDVPDLERAMIELIGEEIQSVAVILLHSYANRRHEIQAAEWIRKNFPDLYVSTSSEVVGEIREYERSSTVVIDAYIKPLVDAYIRRLSDQLSTRGFRGTLNIMSSAGGRLNVAQALARPVLLIESGPAAGTIAAASISNRAGIGDVVSFDMGGTTAKIALVEGGTARNAVEFEVGRVQRFKAGSGYPVKIPALELVEIGAGGGSIARIDSLGLLKVGPDSAGADPGPACYEYGGKAATVTDADLVLGFLNPSFFLGGAMRLGIEAARRAIFENCAKPLGVSIEEAAQGIYNVVNQTMANATRAHLAERGKDPRSFTLLAFGGAGPVHACELAARLHISKVLCPPAAGVGSAFGCLASRPRYDVARTLKLILRVDSDWSAVARLYDDMEKEVGGLLEGLGLSPKDCELHRVADMRYRGQGYEISVRLSNRSLTSSDVHEVLSAFRHEYQKVYKYAPADVPVEAVNWRLVAYGPVPPIQAYITSDYAVAAGELRPRKGTRSAYVADLGGFREAAVYDRYKLTPGISGQGPAIIEERESTIVISSRASFEVDEHHNVIIAIGDQ